MPLKVISADDPNFDKIMAELEEKTVRLVAALGRLKEDAQSALDDEQVRDFMGDEFRADLAIVSEWVAAHT